MLAGFQPPVGVLSRTPYGRFPEYHTSADNLEFVDSASLADTVIKCLEMIEVLEGDIVCRNLSPKCEPQLGKRGLYASLGGHSGTREKKEKKEVAMLWVLNLSDGDHTLLDIARRSGLPFSAVRAAADALRRTTLLEDAKVAALSPTSGPGPCP